MKKLLLLLLLPSLLLAQEDKKPRKLFFEIKQGVGLPSIGIKYKNQKGNYWNVGVNTVDYLFLLVGKNNFKFYGTGPYLSYSKYWKTKYSSDLGFQTTLFDDGDDGNLVVTPFVGVYFGKKVCIGFDIITPVLNGQIYINISPTLKIKL